MATTRLLRLAGDGTLCLRIGEHGGILERSQPTPLHPLPPPLPGERTVLAVPGAEVRARWMALEARNETQARATARALLAAEAAGGQDLHLALAGPVEGQSEWLVLLVAAERMRDWLVLAGTLGARPDAVIPDYLLLPAGTGTCIAEDGGDWLVRDGQLAFTAEAMLAARILGDRVAPSVSGSGEVERILAAGAVGVPAANLLQGEFATNRDRRLAGSWRRAGILAALLACSPPALLLAEGVRDRIHAGAGEALHAAVAQRLGIAHAPGTAAAAIAGEHALLAAADRFAADTGALFAAVRARSDAGIERFDYGADGVEAVVRHRGAASGQAIVDALQDAGLEVDAAAGATLGEDTLTTLRMGRVR